MWSRFCKPGGAREQDGARESLVGIMIIDQTFLGLIESKGFSEKTPFIKCWHPLWECWIRPYFSKHGYILRHPDTPEFDVK